MKNNAYLPLYEAHAPGEDSRNIVGNIVASTKKVIKGVTHAIGIAYINNYGTRKKISSGEFDACSLEANVLFEKSENLFRYIVRDVKELFGIALCNSEVNPPGFADAKILAVVNAMAENDDEEERARSNKQSKGDGMVTINDVKDYIREHGVAPNVLFSTEQLTQDAKVKDMLNNEIANKTDELKKKQTELEAELKPLKALAANGAVEAMIAKSDLLKDEYTDVVDYLKSTLKISVDGVHDPQKTVDEAVKAQLDIMAKAKFKTKTSEAGDKGDETKDKDNDDKKGENTNTENKEEKSPEGKEDYTKPADNDLIP